MADQVKITKKVLDEAASILQAVPEDKLDDVASKLGVDSDLVKESLKNPKSKQAKEFFTTSLKKVGENLEGMQKFVDQALGRGKPEAIELGTKREIGVGGQPPAVEKKFKIDYSGRPTPGTGKGFTSRPAPEAIGGPLVPVTQQSTTSRLEDIAARLQNQTTDPVTKAPMSTETALVPSGPRIDLPAISAEEVTATATAAATKAKPRKSGQGIKEGYLRGRQPSLQEEISGQMEQLPEYNLGIGPSKRTMAKAGLGVAGAGAAAAGYRLFGDKPLSQQPDAPSTLKAGDVKDTQELVDLADKAAPTLPPEQAQKAKENAEKIKTIQDLLADVEKRKQQKVDRIELMQAIETMAHGLVTAIGAGVMLNRGSPFAVDFSKGPKVDWASQLDRLQKDFDTQTNALIKKYGIEEDMKAKQEELALKKRGLDIEEQKVAQQVTKQQAEAVAKLTTEQQKQYKDNLKSFAALKEAVQNKKPGDVQQYATILGADDATTAKLTEAMNQGMWDKILTTLGISEQPTTEQILQGLRPQKPAAPAAAPAPATDREAKLKRLQELEAKQKGGQ